MIIKLGLPQMLTIFLYIVALGIQLREHGKPREGVTNFWAGVIGEVIIFVLLIWGGFFK